MKRLVLSAVLTGIAFAALTEVALADIYTWSQWSTGYPSASKQVPPAAWVVKCAGSNTYCVPEIDPTSGAIPVELQGGDITIDYSGPTGSAVPANAAYVAGRRQSDSTLTGLVITSSNRLLTDVEGQVDILSSVLPDGAASSALQTTGNSTLSTINGTLTTINGKTPALGQALMANSVPVAIASDQTLNVGIAGQVQVSNLPATVDVNAGASSGSTLRISEASRTYSDSVAYSYASGNVTTGAWVQVDASTAAAINYLCISDTSGQILELGTGAAAAETRVFVIPQGFTGCIPLRIAASTRLSLRAITSTASTGYFTYSGLQ